MTKTVIKIENVSKLYRVGEIGTGTLSHDLNRWWKTKILNQEDPYTKIGSTNDRTQAASKGEYVWALKDINLDIKEGEIVGVIGKNGAGKSTLLKLLSRVTTPTKGRIKINGRIASLLEVGTGFHPELTGRENIYMNGTIMGLRKKEITDKLDEIVDFAGVAKYLDTPTKRYSSGMNVRLGFAVAAFLEPEILIVDEVLAVGDAEFQKKAIGKLQDVSKGQGRTVLFVSHNMASIIRLCDRGVLLQNGSNQHEGKIEEVVSEYLNHEASNSNGEIVFNEKPYSDDGSPFLLHRISLIDERGKIRTRFRNDESIWAKIEYELLEKTVGMRVNFQLLDETNQVILHSSSHSVENSKKDAGKYQASVEIPALLLNNRKYFVQFSAGIPGTIKLLSARHKLSFFVDRIQNNQSLYTEVWPGVVSPECSWRLS